MFFEIKQTAAGAFFHAAVFINSVLVTSVVDDEGGLGGDGDFSSLNGR